MNPQGIRGKGDRTPPPSLPAFLFFLLLLVPSAPGCRPNDYFLIHPLSPQPGIIRESLTFDRDRLRVHWISHSPLAREPLPGILVHPDAGGLAGDMEGICLDLARRGYFAAAVHYQRLETPEKENPLFPWKFPGDVTVALDHMKNHPRVDGKRVGLLGYSKGGMLSLLIASRDPSVKAVVSYYPLADFEEWLDPRKAPFPRSLWIRGARHRVLKELGAGSWEEAREALRAASPIHQAERIQPPVLLIHGERDLTAPLSQVQDLCRRMREAGRTCELLVVPRAGHVFNFLNEEQGREAWEKTVEFLGAHLQGRKAP